jgi:hypothetical protein
MKNKSILLVISFCAIVTLSFSFVGNDQKGQVTSKMNPAALQSEAPLGGFVLEDGLEK